MSPDRRICLSRARARDKGIHIGSKTPNTPLREVDQRVAPAFGRPPPAEDQTQIGMGTDKEGAKGRTERPIYTESGGRDSSERDKVQCAEGVLEEYVACSVGQQEVYGSVRC